MPDPKESRDPSKLKGRQNFSFAQMSKEEHLAASSKGGKKAQERRLQNKTFKQALEWALEMPAIRGPKDVEKVRKANPDITNREAMAIAMVAETIRKGDVRAFVAVRDTTGELPAQTVNIAQQEPFSISIETIGSPITADPAPLISAADPEEEEEP